MPAAKEGVCLNCKTAPRLRRGRCGPCIREWSRKKYASGDWKKPTPKSKSPKASRYDWAIVERVISGKPYSGHLTRRERFEVVRLSLRDGAARTTQYRAIESVGLTRMKGWITDFRTHALKHIAAGPLKVEWHEEFSDKELGI